ncbi:DUF3617 domain-containing protein [Sphingomonas sp. ac-8]|uniref:DUF3617 domain-containing protein n=1 Tax=Sphingomonas sp. ac-8 TaxID=3242977 RepID=UPI003A7FFA97
MGRRDVGRALVIGAALSLCSASAVAVAPGSAVKATTAIEPGQWLVRERGAKTGGRSLCLRDASGFFQMRHPGAQCSRFVVANEATRATVHYTCPGAGHGRTTLTVETPHSITVETQGIASGMPFQDEYQIRRVGGCTPGRSR